MGRAKKRARKCLEELRWRGRASGEMGKAEEYAGVNQGYLRKAMHDGYGHGINLERFFALLEGLETSPSVFFSSVFSDDREMSAAELIDPPRGPRPAILDRVEARLLETTPGGIRQEYLLELDDLRYDDPEKAASLAEKAVEFTAREWIPLLLGVFASACRPLLRLEHARFSLRKGIDLAERNGDPAAVGDLVQRSVYLQIAEGRYSRALLMGEKAGVLFSRSGDLEGLGRSLIDQGIALFYLEKTSEAGPALLAGMELVPPTYHRYHCGALQTLGLISLQEDSPSVALEYFDRCLDFAKQGLEHGKLAWVRAGALARLSNWSEAHAAFETAIEALLPASPVDAALCVCDQVQLLLDSSQNLEAVARSRTMRSIVVPLEDKNIIASAAARDLLSCETRGGCRLTVSKLNQVKRLILESRKSYPRPAAVRA